MADKLREMASKEQFAEDREMLTDAADIIENKSKLTRSDKASVAIIMLKVAEFFFGD